jgi:TetR/AcrR family transcriptional repressor of nem operon
LGAELAREYTDKFLANLGDPANLYASGKNPISIYVEQFRVALIEDKKMCLCGLLGAETDCLPDKVKVETKRFFQQNLGWLEHAYTLSENHEEVKLMAIKTIAMLEGAMMISKTLDDPTIFLGITELFA